MKITKGRGKSKVVIFDSNGDYLRIADYINKFIYTDKIKSITNIKQVLQELEFDVVEPVRDTIFRKVLSKKLKDAFGCNCCKKVNKQYWLLRGYTKSESEVLVVEEQRRRANKQTIESNQQKSITWHKGAHRQDRGYKFYIDKGLSPEEATLKINERNNKWQSSLNKAIEQDPTITKRRGRTKTQLIETHGVDVAENIIARRLCNFKGVSKLQMKFINDVIRACDLPYDRCQFDKSEFFINSNDMFFQYDFKYQDKIIEFNGDYWHLNPSIYTEHCVNAVTGKTGKETWQYDKIKASVANEQGYSIMTVWEKDYRNNKDKTLERIKKYIYEEYKH